MNEVQFTHAQTGANRKLGKSILCRATEEFIRHPRPSIGQVARYKELFYPLCLKSNSEERSNISTLLAQYPYAPRPIILFFALDDIDVAKPCLLYSPVLNERDLIELALKKETEHGQLIAKRSDLTLAVVNAVLSVDDDQHSILKTLKTNKTLAGNLEIEAALRRATLLSLNSDEDKGSAETDLTHPVHGMLDENDLQDLSEALLNLASLSGRLGKPANQNKLRYKHVQQENAAQLLRSARALNHDAFAYTIQRMCSIDKTLTLDAISKKDTGFLAVLLKANEVPKLLASKILLILTPDLGRDVKVLKAVLEKYEMMEVSTCMQYLEERGGKFGPQMLYGSRTSRNAINRSRSGNQQAAGDTLAAQAHNQHALNEISAAIGR